MVDVKACTVFQLSLLACFEVVREAISSMAVPVGMTAV